MGESAVLVRDMAEADREEVRSLLVRAYEEYSARMPDRWEAYKESIEASVDAEGPKARLVAELDGRIVGSAQLFLGSESAYGRPELDIRTPILRLLAVSPSHRGRGIATEIIRESARRALSWGADTLHLHTSDLMASAVRLYERLGFERAYDKEFYNGETLVKSYRLRLAESALV
ncbi:N-acetyltransferase [Cohnella xylanilytica]|uniref:GNAT family N-acetyltransferase n=1 Tax=Cohnella xylanilytica TaxID=557555 RepID=A0A841U0H1_9BACL|nr:GNAT family N-acetyltransferase [Cohnella xylanilytica]MBB6691620.1 GNAT family N-acetyltransferase [Cohnella xylanilytica]GIO14598.1 N-acetyltransferase [Cohnella xylanilytica]